MQVIYCWGIILAHFIQETSQQCAGTTDISYVGYTTVSVSPPGYPSPGYGQNLNCSWLVNSTISGAVLLLKVLELTASCVDDAISVYDGTDTSGSQLILNQCAPSGTFDSGYKTAATGNIFTTFISGDQKVNSELGFQMYVISANDFSGTGCSATQTLTATSTEQYLTSQNFPAAYDLNTDCSWLITTDANSNVYIEIRFMEVEFESSCSYDYLKIIDSDGSTVTTLCEDNKHTVWNPTGSYTSSGSNFTIQLHSDSHSAKQGFLLAYTKTAETTTNTDTTTESSTATVTSQTEQTTTKETSTESLTTRKLSSTIIALASTSTLSSSPIVQSASTLSPTTSTMSSAASTPISERTLRSTTSTQGSTSTLFSTHRKITFPKQAKESSVVYGNVPSPASSSTNNNGGSNTGMIVGISVGCVVAVSVAVGAAVLAFKHSLALQAGSSKQPKTDIFGNKGSYSIKDEPQNIPLKQPSPILFHNKVGPPYQDYIIYALPECTKVMPQRPIFFGDLYLREYTT